MMQCSIKAFGDAPDRVYENQDGGCFMHDVARMPLERAGRL
jgi:hypothetical protein